MEWLYKGKPVTDEVIPKGSIGFLYMITHKNSNRLS